MKLISFWKDKKLALGVKMDKGILDVSSKYEIGDVLAAGEQGLISLREYTEAVNVSGGGDLYEEGHLHLAPAILQPQKIICVGLNYRKHAEESGMKVPEEPILFSKFANALAGHMEDIELPSESRQVDYEAELAIVIGQRTRNVAREEALENVFGYCCANDLSARDLQFRSSQWLLGKSSDGFAPIGPYLVTADEITDPNHLTIRTLVNGEVRQNSNTSDMIFHCDEIISYISRHMSLEPGDLILTGTPEGVIMGLPDTERLWLKDGDIVTIEIEQLGSLTNRMISR